MKLLICCQTMDKNDPILGFFHGWVFEFAKHFECIEVICLKEGVHELPSHVQVYSLGKEKGVSRLKYLLRFYYYFFRCFFVRKVDFVFFHMGWIYNILAVPFFFLRKLRGTKFYWWKTHGDINVFERCALWFVDRVYTASPESFDVETRKRQVVGHAIDVSYFTFSNRERITPTVLSVGRIMPVKKIEMVIDVARELRSQTVPCDFRIVGSHNDKEYMFKLMAMVRADKLEDVVTFVGSKTHEKIFDEYKSSSILLHTSVTGSIDKVVLEAMASGCIPVSGSPAYKDLLSPFDTYVTENSKESLSKKVAELLSNEKWYKDTASKMRVYIEEHHALDTLVKRIFEYD